MRARRTDTDTVLTCGVDSARPGRRPADLPGSAPAYVASQPVIGLWPASACARGRCAPDGRRPPFDARLCRSDRRTAGETCGANLLTSTRRQTSPRGDALGYEPQADFGTPLVGHRAVTLTIDGRAITVPAGTSVMRAAALSRRFDPQALRHRQHGRVRIVPPVPGRDRRGARHARPAAPRRWPRAWRSTPRRRGWKSCARG